MQTRELGIPGSVLFTPQLHSDARGTFVEWYRHEALEEAIGHRLDLRQANLSVSGKGVVRGIHYALVPPGQAKYVTVTNGSILDFIVDVRDGSPTFGRWDSVVLDDRDRCSLYLSEGLGHAFVALEDRTTVSYLVSEVFNPDRELGIDPFDEEIGLVFPPDLIDLELSDKDRGAPGLSEARARGLLPTWQDSTHLYDVLTRGG